MSRVVVIDSDGPAREHFTRVLESAGHDAVAFTSSREALEAIAAEPPDLVLVEIAMPDVDGIEFVRALRGLPETFDQPVIFTSALYTAPQFYNMGVVCPRCVLLPKPATPRSILSAVSAALGERLPHGTASQEGERRYVELIESLPNGVVAVDAEGLILLVNDQAERMFGYLRGELIGRPFEQLLPERLRAAHIADRARLSEPFHSRVVEWDHDLRGRRKDGGEFPIEVSLSASRTDQGYVVTRVITDVTDRKALEAQLVHSQKLEALGRLAGGIAHDFNNLLQVINGYGESLAQRVDTEPEAAELAEIRAAADRAAALTNQLLAFSRRQVIEPRALDLNRIVMEMEQMLARVIGEDVALSIDLEPELWPIRADEAQVEQVLANLAVNARDAMPGGGRLSVSTRNVVLNGDASALGLDPGEYVRLIVEDTGCGMDSGTIAHAFEPFYTTKGEGNGTGLGLATVHGIVSQGHGRVLIESDAGCGTQIISYLPRTREPAGPTPDAPTLQEVTRGTERILLVEDEPVVRRLFEELLGRLGYEVTAVARGDDAVAAHAAADGFDIVVTDLVMPGMSGRELVARLGEADTALPVLFVSGFAQDAAVDGGHDGPRSSFLQKPFTGDELARGIRTLLDAPETS